VDNLKIKFEDLNLSKEVLKAISDIGYTEASPIQAQAIPFIMQGHDVTGLAMTGTGKTAAFCLPLVDKIDNKKKNVQALIVCPTRELAIQVSVELNKYLKYKPGISVIAVYGGQPIDRQLYALRRGPQVVVGTPGRLLDHLDRRSIDLNGITTVILDEADEMMNMGFRTDIEKILTKTPKTRQTITFSATMPRDILDLVKRHQKDPKLVQVSNEKSTATTVEQYYYEIENQNKLELLVKLLNEHNPYLAIVFCNTKRKVDNIAIKLRKYGFSVEGIHGDISQPKRNQIMDRFRAGKIQILIATDVAARGIDVPNIDIIFNYEIPDDEKSYVHRIGRTGRAGKVGKSFSFVSEYDFYSFRNIRNYTKTNVTLQHFTATESIPQSATPDKAVSSATMHRPEATANPLILKIQKALQQDLNKHIDTVESLVSEENPPIKVAAALVKLLSQSASSSRPQYSENRSDERSDRSRYSSPQRRRRY